MNMSEWAIRNIGPAERETGESPEGATLASTLRWLALRIEERTLRVPMGEPIWTQMDKSLYYVGVIWDESIHNASA